MLASMFVPGDVVDRLNRHRGKALAAVVLLTGMNMACSGPDATSKAPQSQKATSSSAVPTAGTTPSSDRERLDAKARDLLGRTDQLGSDDADFVSSGSLAIPGMNLDETVESGVALRVEVACVGEGTVTFTAVSGTVKKATRVDCTRPMTGRVDITTAGPSLAIQADSPETKRVGTAYVVRRAT
ncbi:hypothetical protein [Streptomyces sp. NPDC002952]|uniref:hypothetical protein n=1 Tax=Streptomyces sp. NPDC002952 TaxID=3364673 RepID=UPI0036A5323A